MLALLRHRTLRRVFAVNALLAMAWDLHSIFVPIYGERIGLSASEIGLVLSSFAAATFAVRFSMGTIARRLTEHQVLTGVAAARGRRLRRLPAVDQRARTPRALVHARPGSREQPADGAVAAAHARAARTHRRGGRRSAVARQHDVGRRAARAGRCRRIDRDRTGVLVRGHVPDDVRIRRAPGRPPLEALRRPVTRVASTAR